MEQSQDSEHVRLLSIFHFVMAGFTALFALFPVIYVILGIAMLTGMFDGAGHGPPSPPLLGLFFFIFGLMFIALGEAMAVCVAIAGYHLGRHSGYTFCLVVAAIECLSMPFGTILGVFTIVVLMRPAVRAIFDSKRRSTVTTDAASNSL